MTPLEQFLSNHGLVALLLLATFEGDLSIVIGGVLAHLGLLSLPGVMAAGAVGNLIGDCAWFAVGRRFRVHIRETRFYQAVGPQIERVARRFGAWQLLAARVVYGTRNMSMVFWGQQQLPLLRFLLIDALGCALAAVGFGLIGNLLGNGTTAVAGQVKRVEVVLLIALAAGALVVWGITRLVRRKLGR